MKAISTARPSELKYFNLQNVAHHRAIARAHFHRGDALVSPLVHTGAHQLKLDARARTCALTADHRVCSRRLACRTQTGVRLRVLLATTHLFESEKRQRTPADDLTYGCCVRSAPSYSTKTAAAATGGRSASAKQSGAPAAPASPRSVRASGTRGTRRSCLT